MKDCVIVETYIEAARLLRAAGLQRPIVFTSSNTTDYHGPSSTHLAPELRTDFAKVSVEYAPNFGAAQHFLDL